LCPSSAPTREAQEELMKAVAAVAALLTLLLGAAVMRPPAAEAMSGRAAAEARRAELSARPSAVPPARDAATGLREIGTGGGPPASLYVPARYRSEQPMPLVLMLHGAGGTSRHALLLAQRHADRLGFILLAPKSNAPTWDVIAGRRYGADARAIDAALRQVFAEYAVDPERIAIAGFSDGASYALSLGLSNGRLFRFVIAFSPGFMAPAGRQGSPRIFVSHGVEDRVLPIDSCSRRLVPQLRQSGYAVDYREFRGGHAVSEALARTAFAGLVNTAPGTPPERSG
jgi:predicted esterase